MIDLIVTTCDRIDLMKLTISHILARTTTPYRLHVIDDASIEANAAYVRGMQAAGLINSLRVTKKRRGIPIVLRLVAKTGQSDPLVFTDDDVLCPLIEPDWLARGLQAMAERPKLGLLALNSPQCNIDHKRGPIEPGPVVTVCRNIPGTFVFARRAVLQGCLPPPEAKSPVKVMCRLAREQGWEVGYLTEVFCQHIGSHSIRLNKKDFSRELELVQPIDPKTLAPPEQYRW